MIDEPGRRMEILPLLLYGEACRRARGRQGHAARQPRWYLHGPLPAV